MNTRAARRERARQRRVPSGEIKAEHLRNDVVYWGVMFFAAWGVVRAAEVSVEAICRALGVA